MEKSCFSDENHFEVHGRKSQYVRRSVGEPLNTFYVLQALKVDLDRYIGQPIYIGRYQGQADISYRCSPPLKYRLRTITLNFIFESKRNCS